jgi:hypothetical protein
MKVKVRLEVKISVSLQIVATLLVVCRLVLVRIKYIRQKKNDTEKAKEDKRGKNRFFLKE